MKRNVLLVDDQSFVQKSTVKCSLGALLRPEFSKQFEQIILFVSQMQSLVSLTVKRHLFQTLEAQ
jgi:hypothetical protein